MWPPECLSATHCELPTMVGAPLSTELMNIAHETRTPHCSCTEAKPENVKDEGGRAKELQGFKVWFPSVNNLFQ